VCGGRGRGEGGGRGRPVATRGWPRRPHRVGPRLAPTTPRGRQLPGVARGEGQHHRAAGRVALPQGDCRHARVGRRGARLAGQAVQSAEGSHQDLVHALRVCALGAGQAHGRAAATTSTATSTRAGGGAAIGGAGACCLRDGGMWPCGCAGCMCRRPGAPMRPCVPPADWRSVAAHHRAPHGAAPPCSPVAGASVGRPARQPRRLMMGQWGVVHGGCWPELQAPPTHPGHPSGILSLGTSSLGCARGRLGCGCGCGCPPAPAPARRR
jgi:hypothetical protein